MLLPAPQRPPWVSKCIFAVLRSTQAFVGRVVERCHFCDMANGLFFALKLPIGLAETQRLYRICITIRDEPQWCSVFPFIASSRAFSLHKPVALRTPSQPALPGGPPALCWVGVMGAGSGSPDFPPGHTHRFPGFPFALSSSLSCCRSGWYTMVCSRKMQCCIKSFS